jgi:hypothetical protein
MSKMSDIHDSTTCTADHGQPCGECGRRREQEADICIYCHHLKLRPWRGYCQHEISDFSKRPVRYCGCSCKFPSDSTTAPDPFPLESPPLRSLVEGAADDGPQICRDGECCAQCCLNPEHEHYRGRRRAAADDELADPDPIDHGPVSPELLALGHALIIQPFDDEWAKADERYKRDRHAALHWWLVGARSERDDGVELLELDAEEIGQLLKERME